MLFKPREKRQVAPSLKVVIAGGGTGGHLFPGIAIAQAFLAKEPENRILFISSGNSFEKTVLSRSGFSLKTIPVAGIKGMGLKHQVKSIFYLPKGVFSAARHLYRFKPDLVISMGSYSAGPVAMGAWMMGIPVVLHEQNFIPGVTNRILSRIANRVYLSFQNGHSGFNLKKVRYSGNPVRMEFFQDGLRPDSILKNGKSDQKPFTVLIVGGSQGAHSINMAIIEALVYVKGKEDYFFVHQTGAADEKTVQAAYDRQGLESVVRPFFDNMALLYQKADLVICRSGATTVAEITALGKAAIFIPFPYAADNHQVFNAKALVDAGAAEMILEGSLSGQLLARRMAHYAANPQLLTKMGEIAKEHGRPDAAETIVNDCCSLLKG